MKQITPEVRVKIFALYWGQFIGIQYERTEEARHLIKGQLIEITDYISVKPLSSISEEDAVEVADICYPNPLVHYSTPFKINLGRRIIDRIIDPDSLCDKDTISVIDYLRSKGYALPYMEWSVPDLIEAGVFKLREVEK